MKLLIALLAVNVSHAAELDRRAELANQNFIRESRPASTAKVAPAALACQLPSPLPSAPPPGATVGTFNGSWSTSSSKPDAFTATLWREPCANDQFSTTFYLRVVPTAGTPFLCSSGVKIISAGNQFDVKLVQTQNGSSFCSDVHVGVTVAIDQYSFDPQFDRNQALTLIYEGFDKNYSASLPAWNGTGPGNIVRFPANVPLAKWMAAWDVYAAIVIGDWTLAKQRFDAHPQDVADSIGAVSYWYTLYPK